MPGGRPATAPFCRFCGRTASAETLVCPRCRETKIAESGGTFTRTFRPERETFRKVVFTEDVSPIEGPLFGWLHAERWWAEGVTEIEVTVTVKRGGATT